MNFEEMQKAWQSQDAGTKVTINADVLLKEVRRNQRQFWATIFWRDVRESVVAFLLTLFFLYLGAARREWTDYLLAFACFGVGAFFIVDRRLQCSKRPAVKDSLKACIESSLHQVNHQIWLLKNVFWWYLLPLAAASGIAFCASAWRSRHDTATAVSAFMVPTLLVALVYWGIYRLNQFAVRKDLEPRRQELETLLAGLE